MLERSHRQCQVLRLCRCDRHIWCNANFVDVAIAKPRNRVSSCYL
ncbi:hypothetical protein [Microseira sp. BLCC-F43]